MTYCVGRWWTQLTDEAKKAQRKYRLVIDPTERNRFRGVSSRPKENKRIIKKKKKEKREKEKAEKIIKSKEEKMLETRVPEKENTKANESLNCAKKGASVHSLLVLLRMVPSCEAMGTCRRKTGKEELLGELAESSASPIEKCSSPRRFLRPNSTFDRPMPPRTADTSLSLSSFSSSTSSSLGVSYPRRCASRSSSFLC